MRKPGRVGIGLLLACSWCLAPWASAQGLPEEIEPFALTPAELLAAAAMPAPREKFDAVMLHDASRFEFDERHRLTLTTHQVYRIDATAAIVEYDQVRAIWDPSRQDRPFVRARVVTRDGREHRFDPATLSDESARDPDPRIYDDVRMLRGPLPAIAIGSVIEIETVIVDREPAFAAGRSLMVYVGAYRAVERTVIEVSAPVSLPLRHATRKLPDAILTDVTGDGRRTLTLRHGPLAIDFEKAMIEAAGELPVWPQFLFSTGESWETVADAYAELALPFIRPDEVRSLMPAELPAEREQLVGLLLETLHERVRYTGVLFGQGKIVPNPPSVTLERRFGDCKDKAVVFASMLQAAGLPAQIVLLNADTGVDLDPGLPGIGVFNHMIVHVPGERPLWIDATVEHLKVGDLPVEDSRRWALVIGAPPAPLVRTPELEPADNVHAETRVIRLADFGRADLHVTGRMNGSNAILFRKAWSDEGGAAGKRRDEGLKAMYASDSVGRFATAEDAQTGFLTYDLEVKGSQFGQTEFAEAHAALWLWSLFDDVPYGLRSDEDSLAELRRELAEDGAETEEPPPPRTADWVFEPSIGEWRVEVVPPTGFLLRSLPESRELTLGPARFSQRFERHQDGRVTGTIRFDSVRGRYTAEEGRAFRAAYLEQEPLLNVELRFDHEAALLMARGDAAGAVRRHEELIAAEPEQAIHRMRAALALRDLGQMDAARAEAQAAVRLAPKDDVAFVTLGSVLEHDEFGRRFGRGFDRAGAMRAYREAIRLAPDKYEHLIDLAAVAEHDDEGVRYGASADLVLAIDSYRKFLAHRKHWQDGKALLLQALWHAGRYDEVAKEAADVADDSRAANVRLAARIMSVGVEAALREDARRGDAASRQQRLQGVLPLLWFGGHYEQARAVTAAGGFAARREGDAMWMQVLERTVAAASLPAPADSAAGTADAVMRLMVQKGADARALKPYLSERAMLGERVSELIGDFESQQRMLTQLVGRMFGQNPSFLRDMLLSNVEYQESEAAADARRVAMLLGGNELGVMYAVPEKKRWRLLTVAPYWHPIGREVVALLDAGDLTTARAWLELVRDDAHLDSGRGSGWPDMLRRALPRGVPAGDAATMRLAAYVLQSGPNHVTASVEDVQRASATAETDEQRQLWQILLFLAAQAADDDEQMLAAATGIAAQDPGSENAFWYQALAYASAGNWTASERASREWLEEYPGDARPQQMLVDALNGQGRSLEGLELMAPQVRRGRASAEQLNSYAWQALVADAVDNAAVMAAESAFSQQQRQNYATGHTLACLYAVTGRAQDAQRLLIEMIDKMPEVDPQSGEIWLIRGLIAEGLGAVDGAASAYRRIERPEQESPGSVYDIAAARLAKLARP